MDMNVLMTEGHLNENNSMKTSEKMNYGFKSEQHYQNNYAFSSKDFRINQIKNQNFIVPWQIVEKEKKEVSVD